MSIARSYPALPLEHWPTVDQIAWLTATGAGDEISSGPAATCAPRSQEDVTSAYGRYIGFLRRTGRLRPEQGGRDVDR